ncbi:MAG: DUF4328 domain-containing protein [Rhizobiaceae bacterium]|nr:DUF4328 domain-containing protein [Rhizobiaceae bacterium]
MSKEGFINSDALTKWVVWFLYVQMLVAVISLVSGNMEYQLLTAFQDGAYTSQDLAIAHADASDKRQQLVAYLYLAVFFISGVLILKWIHRANFNARQLGAAGMEFTPGWSIGWYFIPIFTLWKPYQAMKEIWKASHNPGDWKNVDASASLSLWWFLWIGNSLLGQAVFRMSMRAEELPQLISVNIVNQISDVTGVLLSVATLWVINQIHGAQTRHSMAIGGSS